MSPLNFSSVVTSFSFSTITVQFSWSPPPLDSTNGVILGYTLTCVTRTTPHSQEEKLMVNVTDGTSYSLTDLEPETGYTCSVCAYTVVGCGPSVSRFVFTHEPLCDSGMYVHVPYLFCLFSFFYFCLIHSLFLFLFLSLVPNY